MNESPNLNYIVELAAGSKEFEQKLISIVKREFPEEKNEFIKSYDTKSYTMAAEHVHKLKHKVGMLGFETGYQTTIDFEEDLKLGNPSNLHPKFMLILESIEDFLKAL